MNRNKKIALKSNQNIIIEFTNERIIPASGLAVAGALLGKSSLAKNLIVWMLLKMFPAPTPL